MAGMEPYKIHSPLDILMSSDQGSEDAGDAPLSPDVLHNENVTNAAILNVENPEVIKSPGSNTERPNDDLLWDNYPANDSKVTEVLSPAPLSPEHQLPRSILKGSLKASVVASSSDESDTCIEPKVREDAPKPLACLFTTVFEDGPLTYRDYLGADLIPEELKGVALLELLNVHGLGTDRLYPCLLAMGVEIQSCLPFEKCVITRNVAQACRAYGTLEYRACSASAAGFTLKPRVVKASEILDGAFDNTLHNITVRELAPLLTTIYCVNKTGLLYTTNGVQASFDGMLMYLVYLVFKHIDQFIRAVDLRTELTNVFLNHVAGDITHGLEFRMGIKQHFKDMSAPMDVPDFDYSEEEALSLLGIPLFPAHKFIKIGSPLGLAAKLAEGCLSDVKNLVMTSESMVENTDPPIRGLLRDLVDGIFPSPGVVEPGIVKRNARRRNRLPPWYGPRNVSSSRSPGRSTSKSPNRSLRFKEKLTEEFPPQKPDSSFSRRTLEEGVVSEPESLRSANSGLSGKDLDRVTVQELHLLYMSRLVEDTCYLLTFPELGRDPGHIVHSSKKVYDMVVRVLLFCFPNGVPESDINLKTRVSKAFENLPTGTVLNYGKLRDSESHTLVLHGTGSGSEVEGKNKSSKKKKKKHKSPSPSSLRTPAMRPLRLDFDSGTATGSDFKSVANSTVKTGVKAIPPFTPGVEPLHNVHDESYQPHEKVEHTNAIGNLSMQGRDFGLDPAQERGEKEKNSNPGPPPLEEPAFTRGLPPVRFLHPPGQVCGDVNCPMCTVDNTFSDVSSDTRLDTLIEKNVPGPVNVAYQLKTAKLRSRVEDQSTELKEKDSLMIDLAQRNEAQENRLKQMVEEHQKRTAMLRAQHQKELENKDLTYCEEKSKISRNFTEIEESMEERIVNLKRVMDAERRDRINKEKEVEELSEALNRVQTKLDMLENRNESSRSQHRSGTSDHSRSGRSDGVSGLSHESDNPYRQRGSNLESQSEYVTADESPFSRHSGDRSHRSQESNKSRVTFEEAFKRTEASLTKGKDRDEGEKKKKKRKSSSEDSSSSSSSSPSGSSSSTSSSPSDADPRDPGNGRDEPQSNPRDSSNNARDPPRNTHRGDYERGEHPRHPDVDPRREQDRSHNRERSLRDPHGDSYRESRHRDRHSGNADRGHNRGDRSNSSSFHRSRQRSDYSRDSSRSSNRSSSYTRSGGGGPPGDDSSSPSSEDDFIPKGNYNSWHATRDRKRNRRRDKALFNLLRHAGMSRGAPDVESFLSDGGDDPFDPHPERERPKLHDYRDKDKINVLGKHSLAYRLEQCEPGLFSHLSNTVRTFKRNDVPSNILAKRTGGSTPSSSRISHFDNVERVIDDGNTVVRQCSASNLLTQLAEMIFEYKMEDMMAYKTLDPFLTDSARSLFNSFRKPGIAFECFFTVAYDKCTIRTTPKGIDNQIKAIKYDLGPKESLNMRLTKLLALYNDKEDMIKLGGDSSHSRKDNGLDTKAYALRNAYMDVRFILREHVGPSEISAIDSHIIRTYKKSPHEGSGPTIFSHFCRAAADSLKKNAYDNADHPRMVFIMVTDPITGNQTLESVSRRIALLNNCSIFKAPSSSSHTEDASGGSQRRRGDPEPEQEHRDRQPRHPLPQDSHKHSQHRKHKKRERHDSHHDVEIHYGDVANEGNDLYETGGQSQGSHKTEATAAKQYHPSHKTGAEDNDLAAEKKAFNARLSNHNVIVENSNAWCRKCNAKGHKTERCQRYRDVEESSVQCKFCGGHHASECRMNVRVDKPNRNELTPSELDHKKKMNDHYAVVARFHVENGPHKDKYAAMEEFNKKKYAPNSSSNNRNRSNQ